MKKNEEEFSLKEKKIKELIQLKQSKIEYFQNFCEDLETEADNNIINLKENKQYEKEKHKQTKYLLNKALEIQKKKWEDTERERKTIEQNLKIINEEINQISEEINQNNKERQLNEKEIVEREKTIDKKTERIAELKKKKQEFEKFKFVLDYKIKELKNDIGPREQEI